jgi:hypothetical protein
MPWPAFIGLLVRGNAMPIHDWSAAYPGLFHHFHQRWISAMSDRLNAGGLPIGYYALAEQYAQGQYPDVLTLERGPRWQGPANGGGVALIDTPPRTRFQARAEMEAYAARANLLAIYHPLGEVVAVIEIVSPGNKANRASLDQFVKKTVALLLRGVHVLVIDLFPPSKRDPQGLHKVIWDEIIDEPFELPRDKPLTLASYSAGDVKAAFVEPVAVGDALPDMPLFLEPERHVLVPLDSTYLETWGKCPPPFQEAVAARPTNRGKRPPKKKK